MTKYSLLDQYVEIVYSVCKHIHLIQAVFANPQQRTHKSVQSIAYPIAISSAHHLVGCLDQQ